MFADRTKQYRNFLDFLNESNRNRVPRRADPPRWTGLALGASAFLGTALLFTYPLAAIVPLVAMAAIAALAIFARPRPESDYTARERLAIEAEPVVAGMIALASNRRLHREIDEASLALLEECSHHWRRVHLVFHSPFWTSPSLPLQYFQIREQSLAAAEASMFELLLMYRHRVPSEIKPRQPIEWVEDVVDEYVFRRPRNLDFLPPSFEPGMKIAERLQALADEAEKVSRELVVDPAQVTSTDPGSALDASITELRNIRAAEEELRQNLNGS